MSNIEQQTPSLRELTKQRVAVWTEQLAQARQKIAELQASAFQLEGAIQAAEVFAQDIEQSTTKEAPSTE